MTSKDATSENKSSDDARLPDPNDQTVPSLTEQYWLQQAEQYGVQLTLGRIMAPNILPENRLGLADDLLDMLLGIHELCKDILFHIAGNSMSELLLPGHLPPIQSAIESLIRASSPFTTVELYTIPTGPTWGGDEEPEGGEPAGEPATITGGDMLQLLQRMSIETAVAGLVDQHTITGTRFIAGVDLFSVFAEINELAVQSVACLWDDFIDQENLWDVYDGQVDSNRRDSEILPVIEENRETEARKKNDRRMIGDVWGDNWEDELDPEGYWLHHPSVNFLKELLVVAGSGLRINTVRAALEATEQ